MPDEMYEYGDLIVGLCHSCEHKELMGDQQPCDACLKIRPWGSQWRQGAEPKEEASPNS